MNESSPQGAGTNDATPPRLSPSGLLPCPFCDSIELAVTRVKGNMVCILSCRSCLMTGPVGLVPSSPETTFAEVEDLVRNLWNTRAGVLKCW